MKDSATKNKSINKSVTYVVTQQYLSYYILHITRTDILLVTRYVKNRFYEMSVRNFMCLQSTEM